MVNAINKLKQRNQNFVNKYGVNDFSRETDNIIQELIKFYNNTEVSQKNTVLLKNKIKRLQLICLLFGVPLQDLEIVPLSYLEFKYNNDLLSGNLPQFDPLEITEFLIDWLKIHCEILHVITDIKAFKHGDVRLNEIIKEHNPKIEYLKDFDYKQLEALIYNGELNS